VNGDVAAVVDEGALDAGRGADRGHDGVGDGAGDGGHGCDETVGEWCGRRVHQEGRRRQARGVADRLAEPRQHGNETFQEAGEAAGGGTIGALDGGIGAAGLDHEVDRPVRQMQAVAGEAVGQGPLKGQWGGSHAPLPPSGQGLASGQASRRAVSP
jgi:hypothetical protein